MADIEIKPNFNISDTYDSELLYGNPLLTIDAIIPDLYINYKLPNEISPYGNSTKFGELNLRKPTDGDGCFPIIWIEASDDRNYVTLDIIGSTQDRQAGIGVDTSNSLGSKYYYRDGRIIDDYMTFELRNYLPINFDYTIDLWGGEYGYPFYINTNLPIFLVTSNFDYANTFVQSFMKRTITAEELVERYSEVIKIANASEEEPELKEWYVYNEYIHGKTDLLEGFTPDPQGSLIRKYEKIKAKGGTLSMVRQADGTYKIMNSGAEIIGSFYGNHTIYDLRAYPNVIFVDSGFVGYWDKKTESDSITCATRFDTNMYYYRNEQDYNDVISGVKKPKDVAENYDEIDKGQKKENNTGEKDKVTVMGKPDWSNIFVNQWLLTFEDLRSLAMSIYPDPNDTDQLEKIQKGISAIFTNPIDAISDLAFYPIDIRRIATLGSVRPLHIAGVDMNVRSQPISKCSDTLVMGEYFFEETEKNYKNYYTQSVQIWLPYIGMKQLDIKRLMGKRFRVEYAFDLLTHQCTAFLFADDILVDYYPGEIGINMPITATNFAQYASNYISLIGSATGVIAGAAANPVMGAAGAIPMSFEMAKTMNINNYRESKGGVTSGIAAFSPQYVYLLFEQLESEDDDDAIRAMRGWPSNAFGRLEEFGGFLSVTDVELDCTRATESEKAEIESLLRSGIRI